MNMHEPWELEQDVIIMTSLWQRNPFAMAVIPFHKGSGRVGWLSVALRPQKP